MDTIQDAIKSLRGELNRPRGLVNLMGERMVKTLQANYRLDKSGSHDRAYRAATSGSGLQQSGNTYWYGAINLDLLGSPNKRAPRGTIKQFLIDTGVYKQRQAEAEESEAQRKIEKARRREEKETRQGLTWQIDKKAQQRTARLETTRAGIARDIERIEKYGLGRAKGQYRPMDYERAAFLKERGSERVNVAHTLKRRLRAGQEPKLERREWQAERNTLRKSERVKAHGFDTWLLDKKRARLSRIENELAAGSQLYNETKAGTYKVGEARKKSRTMKLRKALTRWANGKDL